MGHLLRISLFAAGALTLSSVEAQDATPAPPLPLPMQAAIERLSKLAAAKSLLTVKPETSVQSASVVCSVPLVEMRIENPERFTVQELTLPTTNVDPMPHAELPAPPCK